MNLSSPSAPFRPLGAVGYHIWIGGWAKTAITFVEFALNIHEFLVDIKNKWRFRDNWGSWLVIVKKCFNTIKKSSKDCTYTLAKKKGKLKFNSYVYGGGSQLKELKTAGTSCVPKSSFIRCKGDKIFNFLPHWVIRLLWDIKLNESH